MSQVIEWGELYHDKRPHKVSLFHKYLKKIKQEMDKSQCLRQTLCLKGDKSLFTYTHHTHKPSVISILEKGAENCGYEK